MTLDFSLFDRRHYRTVSVREGYAAWVGTYEQTVEDEMDLRLLERIASVQWDRLARVADLGCGTGRTGCWLRSRGAGRIDGVDLTEEMIEVARRTASYDRLVLGDILEPRLDGGAYGLAAVCLVDEHVRDLAALYREAARLLTPEGAVVLVGYHPQFIMTSGMPTHYEDPAGEPVAIETHVHLLGDHVRSASAAGLSLRELEEGIIDDAWLAKKPKWSRYRGQPISFASVWRRG